ncbi:AAA family ATPase [Halegenticoccus tardaugens]|uniref:AAA family ATPase n=1 Tax=Halegenticoccus tardaugens TaxID=2071624 RepID=UPI00100B7DD1|nr:AAA family ATPase [Halegenticoccus tardaugens]
MSGTATALVGATGGAGTTRTAVELAATLARDGRNVAILDAAFATQGLAGYVEGRIDPDLTALLTDRADAPLDEALRVLALSAAVEGRVACCPVRAPFERLARAKTVAAARRFEERLAEAAETFDHVLVDVPPVAANQAIAAVAGADRVVLVAPATTRGADAIDRMRDRLLDVGTTVDGVLATRGDLDAADASLPACEATAAADAPACLDPGAPIARAAADAAEELLGESLDLAFEEPGLLETVEGFVTRR